MSGQGERRCDGCGAHVPEADFSCPGCGTFYAGSFAAAPSPAGGPPHLNAPTTPPPPSGQVPPPPTAPPPAGPPRAGSPSQLGTPPFPAPTSPPPPPPPSAFPPPGGVPPGPPPGFYPGPPPTSRTGLWILLGVVAVVVLLFGGLMAVTFLGTTAEPQMRQIGMDGKTLDRGQLSGEPVSQDLTNVVRASCSAMMHGTGSLDNEFEFKPKVGRGESGYALLARKGKWDEPGYVLFAAVDLSTGQAERTPSAKRLDEIGRKFTTVVCVGESDMQATQPSVTCIDDTHRTPDGRPETALYFHPLRRQVQAHSSESGKWLGDGALEGEFTSCPADYKISDDGEPDAQAGHARWLDVSDDQVIDWTVEHLEGGTFH